MAQEICIRCGTDKWSHGVTLEDGTFACEDCFTDEEIEESFQMAHFLVTGHYPDSPECDCKFDED